MNRGDDRREIFRNGRKRSGLTGNVGLLPDARFGSPYGTERAGTETSIKWALIRLSAERGIPPEHPTGKLAGDGRPDPPPNLVTEDTSVRCRVFAPQR